MTLLNAGKELFLESLPMKDNQRGNYVYNVTIAVEVKATFRKLDNCGALNTKLFNLFGICLVFLAVSFRFVPKALANQTKPSMLRKHGEEKLTPLLPEKQIRVTYSSARNRRGDIFVK